MTGTRAFSTPASKTVFPQPHRYEQLDSLRGVAALIVVLVHARMIFTASPPSNQVETFLGGHEAVMLFFVLSGFVLSLPYLGNKQQPYRTFVKRRLARIYLPYLAALTLAVIGCALWHGKVVNTVTSTWSYPVDVRSLVNQVLFLGDYDKARYNVVFWSLIYELRVSLLFPVMMFVYKRATTLAAVVMTVSLGLIGILNPNLTTVGYVGIFFMGVLLADRRKAVQTFYRGLSLWQKATFSVAAFVAYSQGHLLLKTRLWHLGDMPVALGAVGLIAIGLSSETAIKLLNHSVPTFLGKISYSLYLVHATVLWAMIALLHTKLSPAVTLLAFLPISVLISWGFYIAVERPAIGLSQAVGREKRIEVAA